MKKMITLSQIQFLIQTMEMKNLTSLSLNFFISLSDDEEQSDDKTELNLIFLFKQ